MPARIKAAIKTRGLRCCISIAEPVVSEDVSVIHRQCEPVSILRQGLCVSRGYFDHLSPACEVKACELEYTSV